jgi:SAM-dependent methyltransferase
MEIFARILRELPAGRLLDLGCGHGAMAVLAHEMGWKVTAVDVRTARMPKFPEIRWVQSDVREFSFGEGDFDCIALLGLLYHLELKDALALLRRCSRTLTIVDTHVSLNPSRHELGYNGEFFDEVGDLAVEHDLAKKSSWGNVTSFWPDEESLLRMFGDCGYAGVYKLLPAYRPDRSFYVCYPATDVARLVRSAFDRFDQKPAASPAPLRRRIARRIRRYGRSDGSRI